MLVSLFTLRGVALLIVLITSPACGTEDLHLKAQAAHQAPGVYRAPAFEGEYGIEAQRALSTWRSSLFTSVQEALLLNNNEELYYTAWLVLFPSTLPCPPDQPETQYGSGDGEKLLCSLDALADPAVPCVVYSFGSNGDFAFEQDVLQRSSCHVYTFDCTFNGTSIHPRHQYVQMCIGSQAGADTFSNVMSYREILQQYSHERVEVVKLDIESFEYDFLADLTEDLAQRLPRQIIVEYHYEDKDAEGTYRPTFLTPRVPPPLYASPLAQPNMFTARGWNITTQDMALLQFHLANLGYGITLTRLFENIMYGGKCLEYTYLRVEDIRSVAAAE